MRVMRCTHRCTHDSVEYIQSSTDGDGCFSVTTFLQGGVISALLGLLGLWILGFKFYQIICYDVMVKGLPCMTDQFSLNLPLGLPLGNFMSYVYDQFSLNLP